MAIAAAVAAVYFLIGSGGGEKSTPAHLRNGRGETHHRLVSKAGLRFGAAAAAVTFGLFVASPVRAVIVPGQGMAGIRLRMSESQVRARLGEPPRITRTRGALGYLVTRLHYPRVDVDLQKLDGHPLVIHILTTHPGERNRPAHDGMVLVGRRGWLDYDRRRTTERRSLLARRCQPLLRHWKPRQAAEPFHDVLDRCKAASHAYFRLADREQLVDNANLVGGLS